MKLMLTSNGLKTSKLRKELSNLLKRKIAKVRIIVIHTAQESERLAYVDRIGKELAKIGILHPNIIYFNIALEKSSPKLENYDAIYMCGGNTYYILDRIRKTKLDKKIKNFAKKRGLYISSSAGSIIAGKNIEIAGWGSEADSNDINLKNLTGLNLTNIAIFPHYRFKLKKEVEEFRKKVNYPVEPLKDKEALIISGKKIKKIMNS